MNALSLSALEWELLNQNAWYIQEIFVSIFRLNKITSILSNFPFFFFYLA